MAGQVWSVAAEGGYMYSDELSNKLRMAMQPLNRFRQFCDAEDGTDKGLSAGENFNWNVYSDVADDGGDLAEGVAMPETGYTITQGQLTVVEKGNSVPYTSKLDDLSLHPVSVVIDKVLKNDANKTLDRAAHAQFDATLLVASATDTTGSTVITIDTDGIPSVTNDQDLDAGVVKDLVDIMKERNIPMYDGDDYYCVGHPTTFRPVKNDLETIHQHTETGFGLIMKGEEGRYENTRFIHQNLISKETRTWGANSRSNWAFFFGEDNVTEGICIPEEMRGKIPDDFGRSKGIAWLKNLFTFEYSHEQLAIAV